MADSNIYDPPPAPPGVSPDTAYLGQVYASGTRAIMRQADANHRLLVSAVRADDVRRPGFSGWVSATLGKLPASIQSGIVLALVWIVLNLGGALFEVWTGRPPPQPTMPTSIVSGAEAAP